MSLSHKHECLSTTPKAKTKTKNFWNVSVFTYHFWPSQSSTGVQDCHRVTAD